MTSAPNPPLNLPNLVAGLRSRMDPSDTSAVAPSAGALLACLVCRLHEEGYGDVQLVCHVSTARTTLLGRMPMYGHAWALCQGHVVAGWSGEHDPKELTERARHHLQELVGPTRPLFDFEDGVLCGTNALAVQVPMESVVQARSMAVVDAVLIDQAVSAHNRPRVPQRM